MVEVIPRAEFNRAFRWDYVTDPPTKLLSELDAARAHLYSRQAREAHRAATRLLRHIEEKLVAGTSWSAMSARLAEIRADGLAVQAIAGHMADRPNATEALCESVSAYEDLLAEERRLPPAAAALYGLVLALLGRWSDSVDPLTWAADGGADISIDLVRRAASELSDSESAVRLLRAVHERYPSEPELAADLALACARAKDDRGSTEADIAAGALFADMRQYDLALHHFTRALDTRPDNPLAALGHCQALLAIGETAATLRQLEELKRRQPNLPGYHAVTALSLALAGDNREALRVADDALTTFPRDPWLLDTRIRLLLRSGDDAAAMTAANDALATDPTDRDWRSMQAEMLVMRNEDTDRAIETLRELAMSALKSPAPTIRLATALSRTGRTDEALVVIERSLLTQPSEPLLTACQVDLLNGAGRFRDAVAAASAALDAGAPEETLALALAESFIALGEHEQAARLAELSVSVDASSLRARRVRGLAYRQIGRFADSIADLEPVLAANEADIEVRRALAACLADAGARAISDGNVDYARMLLDKAIDLDNGNLPARRVLGRLLFGIGENMRALEQVDLGLGVAPDDAQLLATRGQILEAMERSSEAEVALRRAVELDDGLAWAHAELGDLLRVKRRDEEALEHLRIALQVDSNDPWPWASKGAAEYSMERYTDALDSLDRAIGLKEDYAWALGVKGAVLISIDDLDAAREHLTRALDLNGSLFWAWTRLGWVYLLDAENTPSAADLAAHAYRTALEIVPASIGAQIGYAEAQMVRGYLDDANAQFQKIVDGVDTERALDDDLEHTLGWCYLRLQRHEDAIDAFVRSLSIDPSDLSTVFDIGLALLCEGRDQIAVDQYHQGVERTRALSDPRHQRATLREARRDLSALSRAQLDSRLASVDEARRLLDRYGEQA